MRRPGHPRVRRLARARGGPPRAGGSDRRDFDGIIEVVEKLEDLPPNIIQSIEIQSIEFIPSLVAGTRYGVRTGSGVLEITTMSR